MIEIKLRNGLVSPSPAEELVAPARERFHAVFARWLKANEWVHADLVEQVALHITCEIGKGVTKTAEGRTGMALLWSTNISAFRGGKHTPLKSSVSWMAFWAIYHLNRVIFAINQGWFELPYDWDPKFFSNKKAIVLPDGSLPTLGNLWEAYHGAIDGLRLEGEEFVPLIPKSDPRELTAKLAQLIRRKFMESGKDLVANWGEFSGSARLKPEQSNRLKQIVFGFTPDDYYDVPEIERILGSISLGLSSVTGQAVTEEQLAQEVL